MTIFVRGELRVDSTLKESTVLWRYLDAAKFLDFLHNRTLFFARGDQFEDKYEGAFTKSVKQAIERSYQVNRIAFTFEEFKKRLRERVFLNCWHASTDDSMAMWSIYGRSTSAVAITTTVGRLRRTIDRLELPHQLSLAKVEYVKHWRDPRLNIDPYSNVFAYKVKAYDFEKEVRVIIDRFHDDFDSAVIETGMVIEVPHHPLLRSIVVAPEAPPWFLSLVEGVAKKYAIKAPIRRSKLAIPPV